MTPGEMHEKLQSIRVAHNLRQDQANIDVETSHEKYVKDLRMHYGLDPVCKRHPGHTCTFDNSKVGTRMWNKECDESFPTRRHRMKQRLVREFEVSEIEINYEPKLMILECSKVSRLPAH